MIKEELMGERQRRYRASVCAHVMGVYQMASGKTGPGEEKLGRASPTKRLKFHSVNALGPIKGMITQAAGHSLKYTADNNGGVTVCTPTAVSPPIYG